MIVFLYGVECTRALLWTPRAVWRREVSGFRFQLLRQLIHVKTLEQLIDTSSANEENSSGCSAMSPYLQAVLNNLVLVGANVRIILATPGRFEGDASSAAAVPYTVQYEALVFLSRVTKGLHDLKIAAEHQVELHLSMVILMENVFVTMDYVSQPSFVSCAVLGLLGDFQELLTFWISQTQDDDYSGCSQSELSKWLEKCLVWLLQSSCTPVALELLTDNEHLIVNSQMTFVATSSQYPFLQQWFLYLSRMGTAYFEAVLNSRQSPGKVTLQMPIMTGQLHCWMTLLSRKQLITVLAEQDDVMIEVLNRLMQMTTLLANSSGSSSLLTQWYPSLTTYIDAEFDSDLLFADLVETFGRDHLVLLDLLVSNGTR